MRKKFFEKWERLPLRLKFIILSFIGFVIMALLGNVKEMFLCIILFIVIIEYNEYMIAKERNINEKKHKANKKFEDEIIILLPKITEVVVITFSILAILYC